MNALKSTPGGMPRLASEDRPGPRTNRKSTGWTSDVTARSRSLLNLMISLRQTIDQADVAPDRVPLPCHVVPGHPRGPRGGVREGAQDLDRGRLARAVRAEEAKGLTRLNLEVDATDRLKL